LRKGIEPVAPEPLVALQPSHGLPHRPRLETAKNGSAFLPPDDQACIRQHIDVLQHGRERHAERRGEIADRCAIGRGKAGDDGAPGRVRERAEGEVQGIWLKLNHMVK
jgi:hypothetical protein